MQIHKLPDFVYFNHSVHVNRGVSCVECHGQINKMDEVYQAKPLSMSFCLDCHRDPAAICGRSDKITDLDWKWSDDPKSAENAAGQRRANMSAIGRLNRCRIAPPVIDENNSSTLSGAGNRPKYWRSLDQLADTPEFRQWVEREFPAGASELDRPGLAPPFREVHVGLVPAGGLVADGLPPAGREHLSVSEDAGRLRARRCRNIMRRQCRPAARPFRCWPSPTTAVRPSSKAIRSIPTATAAPTVCPGFDPEPLRSRPRHAFRQDAGNVAARETALDVLSQLSEAQGNGGEGLCFLVEQSSSPSRRALQK